jgi:predicted metalloprotease with PDZ domain
MLADILPINESKGRLIVRAPAGWEILTTESGEADNVFNIFDASRSVIAIGRKWQRVQTPGPKFNIEIFVSGERHFTTTEVATMTREILAELQGFFGVDSGRRRQLILSNYPTASTPGQWQAETRGRNVTIISSDMPFRYQSLQRLHEQLRHELFHLWIPNGVNLTGNYDWFYEGFALYESLKLAVALNRIRFEDFLDTLSRAHTIDSAQSKRTSLIEASMDRFSGSNTQVYARGMLVAFLCDIALLEQSKGKRSVENLLTDLYAKHRKPAEPVDANTAVFALLRGNPKVSLVVDKYVTGAEKIEWVNELGAFGIEDADAGPLTTLRVKQKLNGRQKALLDKLGYNNWRKLSPTSK